MAWLLPAQGIAGQDVMALDVHLQQGRNRCCLFPIELVNIPIFGNVTGSPHPAVEQSVSPFPSPPPDAKAWPFYLIPDNFSSELFSIPAPHLDENNNGRRV
jgi:hypothetical protein